MSCGCIMWVCRVYNVCVYVRVMYVHNVCVVCVACVYIVHVMCVYKVWVLCNVGV